MKVTTDILTKDGKDIAFGDYSPAWRFHRKIVHGALCMFGEGSASIEKISEFFPSVSHKARKAMAPSHPSGAVCHADLPGVVDQVGDYLFKNFSKLFYKAYKKTDFIDPFSFWSPDHVATLQLITKVTVKLQNCKSAIFSPKNLMSWKFKAAENRTFRMSVSTSELYSTEVENVFSHIPSEFTGESGFRGSVL